MAAGLTQGELFDMPNQPLRVPAVCENPCCGVSFMASLKDRKRGFGRFHTHACAAKFGSLKDKSLAPASHPTEERVRSRKTQKKAVFDLLLQMPVVRNFDFDRIGLKYIARNRISELRRDGCVIAQKGAGTGEAFLENAYRLVRKPGDPENLVLEARLRAEGWKVHPRERKNGDDQAPS